MIICIQPRSVAGADVGMACKVFFFFSNWDGAPLGVGALLKLRTLRIGSGGNGCFVLLYFGCYVELCVKKIKIKNC